MVTIILFSNIMRFFHVTIVIRLYLEWGHRDTNVQVSLICFLYTDQALNI